MLAAMSRISQGRAGRRSVRRVCDNPRTVKEHEAGHASRPRQRPHVRRYRRSVGRGRAEVYRDGGHAGDDLTSLALQAQRGNRQALRRLAEEAEPLVAAMASRYRRSSELEVEELRQEARVALLEAVESYVAEVSGRRVPFGAWATLLMRRRLSEYCAAQRSNGGVFIRTPRSAWRALERLQAARRRLEAEGRAITAEDLAREAGMALAQVRELMEMCLRRADDQAADELVASGVDPHRRVLEQEQRIALRRALERLPQRQREVVLARFGLDGAPPRGEAELARQLGCGRRAVAGLARRGLERLALDPRLRAWARD